ncbi:MAG: hypothetical protein AB7G37_14640 [Solirubrobacteraceae bacterium]
MPLDAPRDSTIAVVGDGFGSTLIHTTAMYLGFKPEDVTIYGPSTTPIGTYQQFASNLGQTVLRSESESHFLPADWPTFAQLNAYSHRDLRYLWRSIRRKYNPGVAEIMTQATVVARDLGWDACRYPHRVGWLQRVTDGQGRRWFQLFDEQANPIGRAKHVALSMGHGPLAFPPLLARAREDPRIADRIVQGYEAKQYLPQGRYVVLGAGIASVNEWANVLDAGGKVLALTRNPIAEEQDLNVPRCLFESRGIDAFQRLDFDQRIDYLGSVLRGTHPRREGWKAKIQKGQAEGRFDALIGEIDQIEPGPAGLRIHATSRHGEDPGWLDVTGIVAATGFDKNALAIPLLRRLIEHYDIPMVGPRMRLENDCGVPPLDHEDSRLMVMGLTANAVVPNGDTIHGLKYTARRFVADCARAEKLRQRSFPSRVRMQLHLTRRAAKAMQRVEKTTQLA